MKTKTYFAYLVDIWDATGDNIVEHVAGVDEFEVAEATYRTAVARITLRQGVRARFLFDFPRWDQAPPLTPAGWEGRVGVGVALLRPTTCRLRRRLKQMMPSLRGLRKFAVKRKGLR